MQKQKYLILFFALSFCILTKGQQLYPIIDTSFSHFLKDSLPNCVKGDSLIVDSALKHQGVLQINNENSAYIYDIYNADGLQFFRSVTDIGIAYTHLLQIPYIASDSLRTMNFTQVMLRSLPVFDSLPNLLSFSLLTDSLLTEFPDLSLVKNLEKLFISFTPIDSLPSLDSLPHLKELTISSNLYIYGQIETNGPLNHILSLNNNKELKILNLSYNQFKSLPVLDSCPMLQYLIVNHNHLTTLPSLVNNRILKYLDCSYNHIYSLPSMSFLNNLEMLLANNNLLDSLPNLNNSTNLYTLDVDSNQLFYLPVLSGLSNLRALHASANRIAALPDFSISTVNNLDLSHNRITQFPIPTFNAPYYWLINDNLIGSLPEYIQNDSFGSIDISMNKLDFADATAIKNIDNRISFDLDLSYGIDGINGSYENVVGFLYTPQKPFGDTVTITVDTYSDTILTTADQYYADSYQWYHNDTAIAGAVDTMLHIYCATQADAGSYTCHSIGQYFNTHDFRFNYGVTEFESEPQTVIVSSTIGKTNLAALYPAVSSGSVTLKYALPEAQDVTLKIYDLKGSLVYDNNFGSQAHSEYIQSLDLSGLASGSYIARVQYGLGYRQAIRFVILH